MLVGIKALPVCKLADVEVSPFPHILDTETAVLVAFQPSFGARVELPRNLAGRRLLVPTGWSHDRPGHEVLELPTGTRFER